jgi:hypothetical protein
VYNALVSNLGNVEQTLLDFALSAFFVSFRVTFGVETVSVAATVFCIVAYWTG